MTSNFENDSFIGSMDLDNSVRDVRENKRDLENSKSIEMLSEPVEVIISRVIFALLVSISLVMNLLLILAVVRRRNSIHVVYMLTTAFVVPDVIFYSKLIIELVNWSDPVPSWSSSGWACSLWQFSAHLYPFLYAAILVAIIYHAFVTLFLDYSGFYEQRAKRLLPLILLGILMISVLTVAPSAYFSVTRKSSPTSLTHFRQYCDLDVPALVAAGDQATEAVKLETSTAYRLVFELIVPFLLMIILVGFPYLVLLVGLMKNLPAACHSEYGTKMTVVVTLWLVTSYLMLHVATVLHNVFSVFSIWHKLMVIFDAQDDVRVPKYQAYIHVISYILTCIWGIVRPALCFRFNHKLRKALGP